MKSFRTFLKEFNQPFTFQRPEDYDVIVVGGGPAGVQTAIMGASEKMRVLLLDAKKRLGGQARQSRAIENLMGFPKGISGKALYNRAAQQAAKFGINMMTDTPATSIEPVGTGPGRNIVVSAGGKKFVGRTVVLAPGIAPNKLPPHLEKYLNRGVDYGMNERVHPSPGKTYVVVGGGNSAGQAAYYLAGGDKPHEDVHVVLIARRPVDETMSDYMAARMKNTPNIKTLEHDEISAVHEDENGHVKAVTLKDGTQIDTQNVFTFIGGKPHTEFLKGKVDLDDKGYIKIDKDMGYQTSVPGVFAVGDATDQGKGRIAAAEGEGAGVIQRIHRYMASARPETHYRGGGYMVAKNEIPKGPCVFPWQRAADHTLCGKRAQLAPKYGALPGNIKVPA